MKKIYLYRDLYSLYQYAQDYYERRKIKVIRSDHISQYCIDTPFDAMRFSTEKGAFVWLLNCQTGMKAKCIIYIEKIKKNSKQTVKEMIKHVQSKAK